MTRVRDGAYLDLELEELICRACLSQLIRFLLVKLIHSDFICVLHLHIIILSMVDDIPIDSETLNDQLCEF
jgi:hypothetical protein